MFLIGAAVGVPQVFTEREPSRRLRMLEQRLTTWRVAQPLYGLGPMIAAVGVGYLAVPTLAGWVRLMFVAACLAMAIGAFTWSWSLYLRSTRISDFAYGRLPGWPFTVYVLLTIGGLVALGGGLLLGSFPLWLGWLVMGAAGLYLIVFLRLHDIPPFLFYVLLLVVGVALLLQRSS